MKYFDALRKVMSTWPNCPQALEVALREDAAESEAAEMEKVVAHFYCQTFFNYFGRAATLPRRLPPASE